MVLRVNIFGFEIARVELDLDGDDAPPAATKVVEKGVKKISKRWVGWMVS